MNWWLIFAFQTVFCWGLYGIALHSGALGIKGVDEAAADARLKAFLVVGLMYFVFAVMIPAILLVSRGAAWTFPGKGLAWSSVAGFLGAMGALGIILAFGAKGHPIVVMSIVFAGAPIVNAIVATIKHPPANGVLSISPLFYVGILMAAGGACLVTMFNPGAPKPPAKKAPQAVVETQNPSAKS